MTLTPALRPDVFAGRAILVTGASSGLGAATVRRHGGRDRRSAVGRPGDVVGPERDLARQVRARRGHLGQQLGVP